MPELPEVETIVRTLAPQVIGRRITSITVLHAKSLQHGHVLLPALTGALVTGVSRRAKLLLMELALADAKDSTVILAFHLKMTGRFFVHPPGTDPLKHTRIIFDLADGSDKEIFIREDVGDAVQQNPADTAMSSSQGVLGGVSGGASGDVFGGRLFFDDMRTFGYCRIMTPEELREWPFWQSLGPEPLLTADAELALRFSRPRAAIKAVLLDQAVVAGVGNIYADESLFRAGLLPTARASDIALPRLEVLARELKAVLTRSIEECGSSIRDYRDAKGNAGAFQNSFAVYGRKGENCGQCGSALEATRVAGRGTVYCPVCQV